MRSNHENRFVLRLAVHLELNQELPTPRRLAYASAVHMPTWNNESEGTTFQPRLYAIHIVVLWGSTVL